MSATPDSELIGQYWDRNFGPGLIEDGVPREAEQALRAQYVWNVLGRPHILAKLAELAKEEGE